MEEIKSAYERAMERAEKLGRATPAEMKRLEYTPKGNVIAAKYITGDVADLNGEIGRQGGEHRAHVLDGVIETLSANIALPRDMRAKHASGKALEGLQALTDKKKAAKELADQLEHLFTYYEAAVQQAMQRVRQEVEQHLNDPRHAQQQQQRQRTPIEYMPEFQEAVRRSRQTIDAQYEKVLEEHKQRLRKLVTPPPARV